MKMQVILISLISLMFIIGFGIYFIDVPIQAQTNSTMIHSLAHQSTSHTVKVKCFSLAAGLATISQAHGDLSPTQIQDLNDALASEGVANDYNSLIANFNEMVHNIESHSSGCDSTSKGIVNGISFK